MAISGILHWFVSQSIFLVAVDYYWTDGTAYDSKYEMPSFMSSGYSPMAMIATLVLGSFMVILGVGVGFISYKRGMVTAGSCSAAMSAACHGEEIDMIEGCKAVKLQVKWGVLGGQIPDRQPWSYKTLITGASILIIEQTLDSRRDNFPHYRFSKTFKEAKDDPLVILHTSGTTGFPKPVVYINDWVATYMQSMQTLAPEGMEMKEKYMCGTRFFVMMSPFHAANIFTVFWIPFANETTIIFPPANLPPTIETFIQGLQSIPVDTAFIPPHFVSLLAANEEYLKTVSEKVDTLFTAGGKAVDAHGNIVAAKMAGRYLTTFGSTEIGNIPDMLPPGGIHPSKTWDYISPHASAGWEFRLHQQIDGRDIYEAVVVRNEDPGSFQPVFKMFADQHEYPTRDLYTSHPTLSNLWKWVGRIDDTVILASGANVSPSVMESGVSEHPAVQGVIMVGNGHLRPTLIIEPRDGEADREEVAESVWATVEHLNSKYFEEHRVLRCHVLVTDQERPMVRSLKGSVQRNATVGLYETDLEGLDLKVG